MRGPIRERSKSTTSANQCGPGFSSVPSSCNHQCIDYYCCSRYYCMMYHWYYNVWKLQSFIIRRGHHVQANNSTTIMAHHTAHQECRMPDHHDATAIQKIPIVWSISSEPYHHHMMSYTAHSCSRPFQLTPLEKMKVCPEYCFGLHTML